MYAILVNGKVVPTDDFVKWAKFFENDKLRIIKRAEIGNITISTVFLGIDHGFGGRPRWFETMIFNGPLDGKQERYESQAEAIRGHNYLVKKVKRTLIK